MQMLPDCQTKSKRIDGNVFLTSTQSINFIYLTLSASSFFQFSISYCLLERGHSSSFVPPRSMGWQSLNLFWITLWILGISDITKFTATLPNSVLHCVRHLATSPKLNRMMKPHVEMLSLLSWIFTQPHPNIYPLSHLFFSLDFTTECAAWMELLSREIVWKRPQEQSVCVLCLCCGDSDIDYQGSLTCCEAALSLWNQFLTPIPHYKYSVCFVFLAFQSQRKEAM